MTNPSQKVSCPKFPISKWLVVGQKLWTHVVSFGNVMVVTFYGGQFVSGNFFFFGRSNLLTHSFTQSQQESTATPLSTNQTQSTLRAPLFSRMLPTITAVLDTIATLVMSHLSVKPVLKTVHGAHQKKTALVSI